MLKTTLCIIRGHRINRRRVWHDRMDFRTRCKVCDRQMVRLPGGWEVYRPKRHADPLREERSPSAT